MKFYFDRLTKIIIFLGYIQIIVYHVEDVIRLAIYTYSLKGGGTERITALLLNYLSIEKKLYIYVFSQKKKEENEYIIPELIKRVYIEEKYSTQQLIKYLKIKRIDILIYQFPHGNEIKTLNGLENLKIIIYSHFCFLTWIYYYNIHYFKILYNSFKESKYVVSLVPFENDYIFKKWGINSILMDNLITYEYENVIPSDLSSKIILMIGRAWDRFKRFDLGILAMQYISNEVKGSEMKIISVLDKSEKLIQMIDNLNLQDKVKFMGYTLKLEDYFHNASLHIFPTISESFSMVLSETKVFGIPSILTGLDFVSMSEKGNIIIYDDTPESIAKSSIKILNNYSYRKQIGKEARESTKKYKNKEIIKKWIKLIFSVYKGEKFYNSLIQENKRISDSVAKNITMRQVELIKMREPFLKNLTLDILLNFSLIEKMLE